ncbi:ATP-binding protein [Ferrimicrobium acidiphilum]|uniref:ATP-binding protein n=1 Tax=Ferrimicrobium acidiphilum TaxID=121039 RepID=A0ABV3Y184_9ACTN
MLATARATDTLGPILAKFQRLDLVVIDDLGILPIGENDSEALYRVVEACYETTSLIVTSNFVLASFDEILNPRSIAAALVDRLAHHAHLIETTGESIRLSQALSGKGVMPL